MLHILGIILFIVFLPIILPIIIELFLLKVYFLLILAGLMLTLVVGMALAFSIGSIAVIAPIATILFFPAAMLAYWIYLTYFDTAVEQPKLISINEMIALIDRQLAEHKNKPHYIMRDGQWQQK
jgi:hypothetical protein